MQSSKPKADCLFLLESLREIRTNDIEKQKKRILTLCSWAIERFEEIQSIPEYMVLYKMLIALMTGIENKIDDKEMQKNCSGTLSVLLHYLVTENLKECRIKVTIPEKSDCPRDYFFQETLTENQKENTFAENKESITIFIKDNKEEPTFLHKSADLILNAEDIYSYANNQYSINSFSYDRIFLKSKLAAAKNNQDVKIWIAGSSYGMVGINEGQMPYVALNAAVNAQDLYYSLLCARKAIEMCKSIQTIVIPMAYYFLFLDMAQEPSDYMLSVLSCVDYPVFKDLNGYEGKLRPEDPIREGGDPVYDAILNKDVIKEHIFVPISKELEGLPYFNSKYNIRPAGGMLSFCFRDKTDEQNTRGAWARAAAHNANFNKERGSKNIELLNTFLQDMQQSGRKVVLFTPPVTRFYNKAILEEMKEEYYSLLNPLIKNAACTFVDLTQAAQFNDTHFQDYDHLNADGAAVLSSIIADYCK